MFPGAPKLKPMPVPTVDENTVVEDIGQGKKDEGGGVGTGSKKKGVTQREIDNLQEGDRVDYYDDEDSLVFGVYGGSAYEKGYIYVNDMEGVEHEIFIAQIVSTGGDIEVRRPQDIDRSTRVIDLAIDGIVSHRDLIELAKVQTQGFNPSQSPSYVPILDRPDIQKYQRSSRVNYAMRLGEALTESEQKTVDSMLIASVPLGETQILYRGIAVSLEQLRFNWDVGQSVVFDTFTSCSRNPAMALAFSESGGVLLEIEADETAVGITLGNEGEFSEDETILVVGQELHIEDMQLVTVRDKYGWNSRYHVVKGRVGRREREVRSEGVLSKAPPGPPPRPGLEWKERTHRWIRPGQRGAEIPSLRSLWSTSLTYSGAEEEFDFEAMQTVDQFVEEHFVPEQASSYVNVRSNAWVRRYVGTAYIDINRDLRMGEDLSEINQKNVQFLLAEMKPLEEPQVLYRGLPDDVLDDISVGKVIEMDAFCSASRSPTVAYNFALYERPEMGTIMEIHTFSETEGITLSNNDTELNESETILNMGQQFKIEEVRELFSPEGNDGYGAIIRYVRVSAVPRIEESIKKAAPGP